MGNAIILEALKKAHDTRSVLIERGAQNQIPGVIQRHFSETAVFLIADENTYAAAGEQVAKILRESSVEIAGELIFPGQPRLKPDIKNVEKVREALAVSNAIPIAVGSGTINDIVKLAAHMVQRAYLAVGTAASMDGYTSFASAITHDGVKKVDPCPAPRVFIADPDVFTQAPSELSSSGYADLIAKVNSGADWIIADAVGSETLQPEAWSLIQPFLRSWLEDPEKMPHGDSDAIENLMVGLVMAGLAMQAARSSWPASGSEHLFSHLWEMRGLDQEYVSHGHKVGLGTIAAAAMVEQLFATDVADVDLEQRVIEWPGFNILEEEIRASFKDPALVQTCIAESRAKYIDSPALLERLRALRATWPDLKRKVDQQIMSPSEVRDRLEAAGCPTMPADIGLPDEVFKEDHARIRFLRARYTSFDLAAEWGLLGTTIDQVFGKSGYWSG